MGRYSIKDLEQLTGIKAHTIRIWEKRYGLLSPHRSDTNIRYYDDEQLCKILNVSTLNDHGMKISKIGNMSESEIQEEAFRLSKLHSDEEYMINQFVEASLRFDEVKLDGLVHELMAVHDFRKTFENYLCPTLIRVGELWLANKFSPAHEHFLSNYIRKLILTQTKPLPSRTSKSVILFTPEWENHELNVLYANYLLRAHNIHTYYLGISVPLDNLKSTLKETNPDAVLFVLTSRYDVNKVDEYLEVFEDFLTDLEVLISGLMKTDFHRFQNKNIVSIDSSDSLMNWISFV